MLGIDTTDVTPPDKAALLKVLKFSLYSKPGSPINTFISTIPGIKTFPFKSIFSALAGIFPFLTFFPTALILPFSSTIKPPISSRFCDGSITLAFIKYFSFIVCNTVLNMPF